MLLGNTIEKIVGVILERASVIQRDWRSMVQCREPKTCSLVLSGVFPRGYSSGSTSFRTALLPLNPLSPFSAERKDWYDFHLLSQVGDPTKPVSYKAQQEAMINALLAAGVFSSKSTHENRRTGARLAGKGDMAVDDTARAGGWTPATLEMTYLSALPCKGIRRRDCCNEELELLTAETARLIRWSQNHSDKISKALAEWETAKKDWLTYETQLETSQMTARMGDGELGDHKFQVKHIVTSSYNPAANGVIGRGNRPIKEAIFKRCPNWQAKYLLGTPHYLIFGQEAVLPMNFTEESILMANWERVRTPTELLEARMIQIENREADKAVAKERAAKTEYLCRKTYLQQQYDMNSLRMKRMQQGKEEERVLERLLDNIARAGGSMAV
ncbi:hypothetical protein LQV05_002809 [Cryptococcus neoformans]|nr:hypothetical protein LQV05_002809 [Cryptococcus neoformans]